MRTGTGAGRRGPLPGETHPGRTTPPHRAEPGAEALSPETAAALAPLRGRIDAIDHEIVALLNERAELALEIGRVKQVTGRRTVRDASREAEVLERVASASAGLFPEPELVALYRKLIAATRRVQHAQKRRGPSDPGALQAAAGDGTDDLDATAGGPAAPAADG